MLAYPSSNITVAKVNAVFSNNPARGKPAISGVVVVDDADDGHLVAIMDSASITARRTAAASAVSVRTLSRPNSRVLAVFGAGVQARQHVLALSLVREFDEVRILAGKASSQGDGWRMSWRDK